jgi:predicted dehydrogenase
MKIIKRREFLGTIGAASAYTVLSPGISKAANDKIVLGVMGLGGRGVSMTEMFLERGDVEVAYLCDVNQRRYSYAREAVSEYQDKSPKLTQDFREILDDPDVDAIYIATPDHWHALATIMACQAGKDVYVEKPLCVTPWEGIKMVEAAKKYERVIQVGSQSRSSKYVDDAAEYVQSGKLGDVHIARVYQLLNMKNITAAAEAPIPEGLDYEMWCGPAPKLPYRPGTWWRDMWDFNTGSIGGDIYHQLDLARYILNKEYPNTVSSSGGVQYFKDNREIPDTMLTEFEYDDLTLHIEAALWTPNYVKTAMSIRDSDQFPDWAFNSTKVEILGTEGFLRLGRHGGGWQAFNADGDMVVSEFGRQTNKEHIANFIECIKSRGSANSDVEDARLSSLLVQLANISSRVGNKKLHYDGKTNSITNSEEANKFIRRQDRKPWVIPDAV